MSGEALNGDALDQINAVLDTCVLLPSPIYNTLLFIAGHHLYQPLWTDQILAELSRNMREAAPRYRKTPAQIARRLQRMAAAFEPRANLDRYGLDYHSLIPAMPNQEKDRHVLAAAVVAEADYLVTENLRDFDLHGTPYDEVAVVTADQFLCALFSRGLAYRVNIISALYSQINASRQLTTIADLLDTLEHHNRISDFCRLIR